MPRLSKTEVEPVWRNGRALHQRSRVRNSLESNGFSLRQKILFGSARSQRTRDLADLRMFAPRLGWKARPNPLNTKNGYLMFAIREGTAAHAVVGSISSWRFAGSKRAPGATRFIAFAPNVQCFCENDLPLGEAVHLYAKDFRVGNFRDF